MVQQVPHGRPGATPPGDGDPPRHRAHPRLGVVVPADPRPPLPGAGVGLLHAVLGLRQVAGQRVHLVQHPPAGRPVEVVERGPRPIGVAMVVLLPRVWRGHDAPLRHGGHDCIHARGRRPVAPAAASRFDRGRPWVGATPREAPGCRTLTVRAATMDGEMSLLDRLRTDRPSGSTARRRLVRPPRPAGCGPRARDPVARAAGLAGWCAARRVVGTAVAAGGRPALAAGLGHLADAHRLGSGGARGDPGVAGRARRGAEVPGGRLHLLPLALTALPVWLCWRAGRRVGTSRLGPTGCTRPTPFARSACRWRVSRGATQASWWLPRCSPRPRRAAGVVARPGRRLWSPGVAGGAAAVRVALAQAQSTAIRRRARSIVAEWLRVPLRCGGSCGRRAGAWSAARHRRGAGRRRRRRPARPGAGGARGALARWSRARRCWCSASWRSPPISRSGPSPGAQVPASRWESARRSRPLASTLGLLPVVPVLGALPSPGPLPGAFQLAVLLPVLVGAASVGVAHARVPSVTHRRRHASGRPRGRGRRAGAAALTAAVLTVLAWRAPARPARGSCRTSARPPGGSGWPCSLSWGPGPRDRLAHRPPRASTAGRPAGTRRSCARWVRTARGRGAGPSDALAMPTATLGPREPAHARDARRLVGGLGSRAPGGPGLR